VTAGRTHASPEPQHVRTRIVSDGRGLRAAFMDHGATWLWCKVLLADGQWRDVVLDARERQIRPGHMGATIGRYANRIAGGLLSRGGSSWQLERAPGQAHQLHGGPQGFGTRTWQCSRHTESDIEWTLDSPAGDQGFPGQVAVTLRVAITAPGEIEWRYTATASDWCPVVLTNHAYFNLDGTGDILRHSLQLRASCYAPVDRTLIPADLQPVGDGDFDFQTAREVGARWMTSEQQRQVGGYDHGFLLDEACRDLTLDAAALQAGDRRVTLSIATTHPALQVYTGQNLKGVASADGDILQACAGIALEPGFIANSPNRPDWPQPSCWVAPGGKSEHVIRYRFEAA
jgi:aldose 1-epimerase